MSRVNLFWTQFLLHIFTTTYSEFLSQEEIELRVKFYIDNKSSVTPEIFYKNVLFNISTLPFTRVIIGYKLKFLMGDYKQLFINPTTEEFDNNEYLTQHEKDEINNVILKFCILLNHHSEKNINKIHGDMNVREFEHLLIEIKDVYNIPEIKYQESYIFRHGLNKYIVSFTQLMYMVAFNQNIFNGQALSDEFRDVIISDFTFNVHVVESLKKTYPSGIPLKYVRSHNLFA